jgi:hypothetical protein
MHRLLDRTFKVSGTGVGNGLGVKLADANLAPLLRRECCMNNEPSNKSPSLGRRGSRGMNSRDFIRLDPFGDCDPMVSSHDLDIVIREEDLLSFAPQESSARLGGRPHLLAFLNALSCRGAPFESDHCRGTRRVALDQDRPILRCARRAWAHDYSRA